MEISKEQIAHDLAVVCANGAVQAIVLDASKEDPVVIRTSDLTYEATTVYKEAYAEIISELNDP